MEQAYRWKKIKKTIDNDKLWNNHKYNLKYITKVFESCFCIIYDDILGNRGCKWHVLSMPDVNPCKTIYFDIINACLNISVVLS